MTTSTLNKSRMSRVVRNNPFGVLEFLHWSHSWNYNKYSKRADLEKTISLMQSAGVEWVRTDFLWGDIEPKEGEFDFAKYDRIVELLRSKGIHILGILHYSADWASVLWIRCLSV